jgi:hypothetical protein
MFVLQLGGSSACRGWSRHSQPSASACSTPCNEVQAQVSHLLQGLAHTPSAGGVLYGGTSGEPKKIFSTVF